MNCAYENYLYIYNIKLIEKNILLIKKITKKTQKEEKENMKNNIFFERVKKQ